MCFAWLFVYFQCLLHKYTWKWVWNTLFNTIVPTWSEDYTFIWCILSSICFSTKKVFFVVSYLIRFPLFFCWCSFGCDALFIRTTIPIIATPPNDVAKWKFCAIENDIPLLILNSVHISSISFTLIILFIFTTLNLEWLLGSKSPKEIISKASPFSSIQFLSTIQFKYEIWVQVSNYLFLRWDCLHQRLFPLIVTISHLDLKCKSEMETILWT